MTELPRLFQMRKTPVKVPLVFVVSLYKLLNSLLDMFRFVLFWRGKIPRDVKRILIFRVGKIGDTICAIPSMVAIRENFPKAEIMLLSSPGRYGAVGAKELLENAEFLDGLIMYYQENIKSLKGIFALAKELRKEKFDLFAELPQNLTKVSTEIRNIVFAKLLGVKYSFGFRINTIKLFNQLQARYFKFVNETERLLRILRWQGLEVDKVSFPLSISEENRQLVSSFLAEIDGGRLVAICPNAKRHTNRWPLERFAEVGKWLISNYNVKIVLIGSNSDKGRTDDLRELIGERAINTAGRFNLLQTVELLKNCQLLISNDTGTIHMAVAVSRPVVGIYGARDFENKWFPYGQKSIVLRNKPACQVCYKERCEHLTCLRTISVNEVKGAIRNVINSKLIEV